MCIFVLQGLTERDKKEMCQISAAAYTMQRIFSIHAHTHAHMWTYNNTDACHSNFEEKGMKGVIEMESRGERLAFSAVSGYPVSPSAPSVSYSIFSPLSLFIFFLSVFYISSSSLTFL